MHIWFISAARGDDRFEVDVHFLHGLQEDDRRRILRENQQHIRAAGLELHAPGGQSRRVGRRNDRGTDRVVPLLRVLLAEFHKHTAAVIVGAADRNTLNTERFTVEVKVVIGRCNQCAVTRTDMEEIFQSTVDQRIRGGLAVEERHTVPPQITIISRSGS